MRPLNISASQAKDYYFAKDPFFGAGQNSKWHGMLAKEFKLTGPVSQVDFLNIISGNDFTGRQIIKDGVDKYGKPYHRAAVDIPFSAPKSVSIMALHVGDYHLINEHHNAVESAIDYIEKNLIFARETKDGFTFARQTGTGLFAIFTHSISRDNDPQLHSHVLIVNCTLTDKGYRTILNDEIYKYQRLLNNIYQSELAKNVKDLGYQIKSHSDGKWEIAGINKEWIDTFSKRKTQIDKEEEKLKHDKRFPKARASRLRNIAVLESRGKKQKQVTKRQLKDLWESQVKKKEIQRSVKQHAKLFSKPELISANDYTKLAYLKAHETESTFTKINILDVGLKFSRGKCTISDIEKEFVRMVYEGEIVHVSKYYNSKGVTKVRYSSWEMKKAEQEILHRFKHGKDSCESFLQKEQVEGVNTKHFGQINKNQKDTTLHILNSKDRFLIVENEAGSDTSKTIKAIQRIIEKGQNNYSLKVLGFTEKIKSKSEPRARVYNQTISSFLRDKKQNHGKQLWVVDESSIAGSFQMKDLIDKASSEKARIVFIGDGRKLKAITDANFIKDLQKNGVIYSVKKEGKLQKNIFKLGTEKTSEKTYNRSLAPLNLVKAFLGKGE